MHFFYDRPLWAFKKSIQSFRRSSSVPGTVQLKGGGLCVWGGGGGRVERDITEIGKTIQECTGFGVDVRFKLKTQSSVNVH